jgi:hypothetical protein
LLEYHRKPLQASNISVVGGIREHSDKLVDYDYNNALATDRSLQSRCNEVVYWKIILKYVELLDPTTLPPAKAANDGFSIAEKQSARKFMQDAGYGLAAENQRQYRIFWKSL